ncbi:MAG: hypothetical protein JW749_01240 [Sedimentisphaerales bacterium]|nr:hypothetical protein [Sedimentisphaerales bacterium]
MNRAQKIAWFNLAVVLVGAALVVLLAVIEAVKWMLAVLLGIVILIGISPFLFRGKGSHVEFDERDQLIRLRALFFASFVSLWCLILQCGIQVVKVGPRGSVPVSTLVGLAGGALISFVITKSLWTLIEYRYARK